MEINWLQTQLFQFPFTQVYIFKTCSKKIKYYYLTKHESNKIIENMIKSPRKKNLGATKIKTKIAALSNSCSLSLCFILYRSMASLHFLKKKEAKMIKSVNFTRGNRK